MSDIKARLDQLFDARFGPTHLGLPGDATLVTGFYLDDADLDAISPFFDGPSQYPDLGQRGRYRAAPVFLKQDWKDKGQPSATYAGVLFTYWISYKIIPSEDIRHWLQEKKVDKEKKHLGYLALDAYERLAGQARCNKADLAPILDAALCRYLASWDIGITFLVRLGSRHAAARDAIREIIDSGKAAYKSRLIPFLGTALPRSFCVELLRRGLHDRSRIVRSCAATRCACLFLTELLPELMESAKTETHTSARFELEFSIAMLSDGYYFYHRDGESRAFVVLLDGLPCGFCWPGEAPPADIEPNDLQKIIAKVRKDHSPPMWMRHEWSE